MTWLVILHWLRCFHYRMLYASNAFHSGLHHLLQELILAFLYYLKQYPFEIFCLSVLRALRYPNLSTHHAFMSSSYASAHSIFSFQLKIALAVTALAAPFGLYAGYKFLIGAFMLTVGPFSHRYALRD